MSEIAIYETDEGAVRLEVRLDEETVWLTQQQIADLFQTSRTKVVEHIAHVYADGELTESATRRNFRQVRPRDALTRPPNDRNGRCGWDVTTEIATTSVPHSPDAIGLRLALIQRPRRPPRSRTLLGLTIGSLPHAAAPIRLIPAPTRTRTRPTATPPRSGRSSIPGRGVVVD